MEVLITWQKRKERELLEERKLEELLRKRKKEGNFRIKAGMQSVFALVFLECGAFGRSPKQLFV